MSASLKPVRMTLEAFLDWERRQPVKYEFDGFGPVGMTGVSLAHGDIQRNLIGLLYNHLRGHRCKAYGSDVKVKVDDRVRYPDAFVVCPPIPVGGDVITNPTIIFEVLSPSTAGIDYGAKSREYRHTPSVRRYVILEQDAMAGLVFSRTDGDWTAQPIEGEATLDLPEIGVTLRMADVYEGVVFPAPDEAGEAAIG